MHKQVTIILAGLAIAPAFLTHPGRSLAGEAKPGQPQYCSYVSQTYEAPAILVPSPKSISHAWRASYNCWREGYSNQQLMYFTADPVGHQKAFDISAFLFDWDDDGALLLVDVKRGTKCAVTVDYWSEDGSCSAKAE